MARYSYRKDKMMVIFSASNSVTRRIQELRDAWLAVINAHRGREAGFRGNKKQETHRSYFAGVRGVGGCYRVIGRSMLLKLFITHGSETDIRYRFAVACGSSSIKLRLTSELFLLNKHTCGQFFCKFYDRSLSEENSLTS